MTLTIRYFAWMRQRTGTDREQVQPPSDVTTVASLMAWLATQSPAHGSAFFDRATIRAAVNHAYAEPETPVQDGDEVAFFPPVTGG